MFGRERIRSVAANCVWTEARDDSVGREWRQGRRLVKRNCLLLIERVRAEVQKLWTGLRRSGCAGIARSRTLRCSLLGYASDDANCRINRAHCPTGKAIEPLPLRSENQLAQSLREIRREQRGAIFVLRVSCDCIQDCFPRPWLLRNLLHHLREQDGVWR